MDQLGRHRHRRPPLRISPIVWVAAVILLIGSTLLNLVLLAYATR
jgi:hypothetical protein